MTIFKSATILIPVIDETEVETVIRLITETCTDEDICEFLIVYSSKTTEQYLRFLLNLQTVFPAFHIRHVLQEYPGLGGALFTGIEKANGSHVITIASDMENDPADVCKMIGLSKENPDIIITASRQLSRNSFGDYPKIKKFFNNGFRLFLKLFLHTKQTDPTYLYQCTPVEIFKSYDFSSNHDAFVLETALIPEIYNVPFIEIPSKIQMRKNGQSHSSMRYYIQFLKLAVKTILKQVI